MGSKSKIIDFHELYEILKVFKLFDSDNYDLDYQVSKNSLINLDKCKKFHY